MLNCQLEMELLGRTNLLRLRFVSVVFLILLNLQDETVVGRISINALPGFRIKNNGPIFLPLQSATQNETVETEEELFICPSKPEITLLNYSRNGVTPDETGRTDLSDESDPHGDEIVWMAPFAATMHIQCRSSSPIQWIFEGPLEPEVMSIDTFRESPSDWPESDRTEASKCFRVVMKLISGKRSTGRYRCEKIRNDELVAGADTDADFKNSSVSSLYLYGEANGPPLLLYTAKEFSVFQQADSPTVVLPCHVVNPTQTPTLYKGNSQIVPVDDDAVSYDPKLGFTLNLQKMQNPFDQYKCRAPGGGAVHIEVHPLPDFRASPATTRLAVVEGNSITLTCEATFPIRFEGLQNDAKLTQDDTAAHYKYKISYAFQFPGIQVASISCVDESHYSTLHSWSTTVITPQNELSSGISYNATMKRFYCVSKTTYTPTIIFAGCNNLMECGLTQKCLSWNAPYKFKSLIPFQLPHGGNTCVSKNRLRPGTLNRCSDQEKRNLNISDETGCSYVPNFNNSSGFVECSLHDNGETVRHYYFNGIKSRADFVVSDWHKAPVDELIGINPLQQNRTFYTKEEIDVECVVSKFLFAYGQIFEFKMQNGLYIAAHEISTDARDAENGTVIVKTSKLKLDDDRITDIVCRAPYWNQTGWMRNIFAVSVKASVPPSVLPLQKSNMAVEAGSNISVPCEATGLPPPGVAWYRDLRLKGKEDERMTPIGSSATLQIDPVNPDAAGEYYCKATNVAGSEIVKLNLDVFQSKVAVYTLSILGVIVSAVFLVVLTVIWRKLRKNQAIVRRLTEKEEKQFLLGDSEALRSIPDGYIRAEFLPYDKKYEIKEENLKIGEEVIDSGAYGIVLKATLCENDRSQEVAVKTSKNSDINHYKALLTELKTMAYIRRHEPNEHIIQFHGAVTRNIRDREVYIVMEYCRLGSLEKFLRANRASFLNQIVDEKIDFTISFNPQLAYQPVQYMITTADLISWAYQIADGMEYLANKNVFHGDLATRNLLLDEDRTVKIIDFGLSKRVYNGSNYVSHSLMPLPWQNSSPETLQDNVFSTKADVWSMGVTLWELFSLGSVPYTEIVYNRDFRNRLLEGLRLEKPQFANQNIYNVMLKCWKNTPAERISFTELKRFFYRILRNWTEEPSQDSEIDVRIPLRINTPPQVGNHYVVNPFNPEQQQRAAHYTTMV